MNLFRFYHSGIIHIGSLIYRMLWKPFYGSLGKGTIIIKPRVFNPSCIYIGRKCSIEHFVWLAVVERRLSKVKNPRLIVEDEVKIGRLSEIFVHTSVVLHKGVRTADNVYISDNTHTYENINIPFNRQEIKLVNAVEIGENCWIGRNACIVGSTIGKHCVVAANAFVCNRVVPDYCVVAGTPAYIIKRYNTITGKWDKTDKEGNFL